MYMDESSLFLRSLRCRSTHANPFPPWLDGSHQLHDSSSLMASSGPRAPRPPDPDPATCRNRAFGSPKPVGPPASYIVDEAEPPWFVIGDVGGKGPFRGGGGVVVGRSQRVESETESARVVDERVMRAAGRPCKRFGGVKACTIPFEASLVTVEEGEGEEARYRTGGAMARGGVGVEPLGGM
jgi:hypothetical protein